MTGRILGADDYGALAALLGVLTIVLLPTGALQLAVSREVSRHEALGEADEADAFGRAMLRLGLLVTIPLVVVALTLTVPLRDVLEIDSTAAVTLVVASLVAALVTPIAIGALLGYQRFYAVALLSVLPFALRLVVVAGTAVAGYRLGGAATATFLSAVVTALIAIWLIRTRLARGARSARPALSPFLRYLWPVFIGLLGIALLTTVDLLVVRARFDPTDAGAYAAASAFARVAFFLPATILAVVFPRTAARQARGEETSDILGRSLIATSAFGLLLALFYGMTGRGLVHTSFGGDFAEGGKYLALLTLSMTIYSLVNVLVGFHLSRDERRYAWIVAAAVPVQVVVLALVPGSIEDLVLANIVVGGVLLATHEVFVDSSVLAALAGIRYFGGQIAHWKFRDLAREGVVVLIGAALFVVVLFWPLVIHLGSTVVGPGSDAVAAMWTFWRMEQEGGYHVFGVTHHTLTGAPFGWDEGNGLDLQALLAYYPVYLAAKIVGPVVAYNLVLLAGYVLSGASMYLLARYLGCARLISAWAGMAFIVFPWHLVRTPHGSLTHLEWLPLLLVALLQPPDGRRSFGSDSSACSRWLPGSPPATSARWPSWRHACSRWPPPRPCPYDAARSSRSARSAPRWERRSSSDSCRSSRASAEAWVSTGSPPICQRTACARWSSSCRRHRASSRAAGSRRSGKAASTAPIRPRSATTWGCSRSPWRWAGCYLRFDDADCSTGTPASLRWDSSRRSSPPCCSPPQARSGSSARWFRCLRVCFGRSCRRSAFRRDGWRSP